MMWLVQIVAAILLFSQEASACKQDVITECSKHILGEGNTCKILEGTSKCLTDRNCTDFDDVASVLKTFAACTGGKAKANCKVEKEEIKTCTVKLFGEIANAVKEAAGKKEDERKEIFQKRCSNIDEFNKCWDEKSECEEGYLKNQKRLADGLMKAADVTCSGTRTYISLALLLFAFIFQASKSLHY